MRRGNHASEEDGELSLEAMMAPEFDLEGSDGKRHSIGEYRRKMLVLYFYPKDNTGGCKAEAEAFRDLYDKFRAVGAEVVGVSKDSLKSHDKFIKGSNLPFVLLSDPTTGTLQAFEAWGNKIMYGKQVSGTIRSTVLIGADGTVLKHWTKIKSAKDHPAEVLAFLSAPSA